MIPPWHSLLWGLAAASTAAPPSTPQAVVSDPGLATFGKPGSPWQVRYAMKASDRSLPFFEVVPADDPDPRIGPHVASRQPRASAGTVYVGQAVSLPAFDQPMEVSADYQSYCSESKRSGTLGLAVFTPEEWSQLATDPAEAQPPVQPTLFAATLHRNRDDVTEWANGYAAGPELDKALAGAAGRTAVLAVMWSTWHPGSDEWFKLDNLELRPVRPRIAAQAWPEFTYREEPLVLRALVMSASSAVAELRFRSSRDAAWKSVPMQGGADGAVVTGTVPGHYVNGPLTVMAPGPAGETWPTLRVRRRAAETRFVAVYQFAPAGESVDVPVLRDNDLTVGTAKIAVEADAEGLLQLLP